MYYGRGNSAYRWKKPFVRETDEEKVQEDSQVMCGHSIEEWGQATEELRMNKKLFAHGGSTSAKLSTIPEENMHRTQTMYVGEGSALSRQEKQYTENGRQHGNHISQNQIALGQVESRVVSYPNIDNKIIVRGHLMTRGAHPNNWERKRDQGPKLVNNKVFDNKEISSAGTEVVPNDDVYEPLSGNITGSEYSELHEKLSRVYEKVFVVDSIPAAREIVHLLTTKYKDLVHACYTEVASIDVKEESPVDHGEVICFSIYSGPEADFRNGKSCIWVDVLDGGGDDLIREFASFLEDQSIKKVWHNYSFDNHVLENYGLKLSGFCADTMHMARLWDSSRRTLGGYSLEALTRDPRVMSGARKGPGEQVLGKVSMNIFGRKKLKKDGSEGKVVVIPPVEELQRDERKLWICSGFNKHLGPV